MVGGSSAALAAHQGVRCCAACKTTRGRSGGSQTRAGGIVFWSVVIVDADAGDGILGQAGSKRQHRRGYGAWRGGGENWAGVRAAVKNRWRIICDDIALARSNGVLYVRRDGDAAWRILSRVALASPPEGLHCASVCSSVKRR